MTWPFKLRTAIILYSLLPAYFIIPQLVRCFQPISIDLETDGGYNWKRSCYIIRDVYVEESCTHDSINGSEFSSELCFRQQMFAKHGEDEIRFNLYDPSNKYLTWLLSAYYFCMIILLTLVFYNFYRMADSFDAQKFFDLRNSKLLKRMAYFIQGMFFTQMFLPQILFRIINSWKNVSLFQGYDFGMLEGIIFLGILGNALFLISKIFIKGHSLQQEQELTI